MRLVMAVIAEGANLTDDGRINVLGILDEVEVMELPSDLGDLVLAMRMEIGYMDGGRHHSMVVEARDEDGLEQWKIVTEVDIGEIEPGRTEVTNQIMRLRRMRVDTEGEITISLMWNGELCGECRIRISLAEEEDGEIHVEEGDE